MEPFIKLDQFLKLANLVQSGGEAKHLIRSGLVSVNGQVETRRGRKLHPGDTVNIEDEEMVVDFEIDQKDENNEGDVRQDNSAQDE